MYRLNWERARSSAIALVLFCLASPPIALAQVPQILQVLVATDGSEDGSLSTLLASALGGTPARIDIRSATSAPVSTNAVGYERLLSDQRLVPVRLLSNDGATPSALEAANAASTNWTLRLQAASSGSPSSMVAVAADATAQHTLTLVSSSESGNSFASAEAVGPGRLVVRALTAGGGEVSRTVITDPRLVRYEAVGVGGLLTGRREFLRRDAIFEVTLQVDPGVSQLDVAAPDPAGGLRVLARLSLQ